MVLTTLYSVGSDRGTGLNSVGHLKFELRFDITVASLTRPSPKSAVFANFLPILQTMALIEFWDNQGQSTFVEPVPSSFHQWNIGQPLEDPTQRALVPRLEALLSSSVVQIDVLNFPGGAHVVCIFNQGFR